MLRDASVNAGLKWLDGSMPDGRATRRNKTHVVDGRRPSKEHDDDEPGRRREPWLL